MSHFITFDIIHEWPVRPFIQIIRKGDELWLKVFNNISLLPWELRCLSMIYNSLWKDNWPKIKINR